MAAVVRPNVEGMGRYACELFMDAMYNARAEVSCIVIVEVIV